MMKKTCNGCRALDFKAGYADCELGYKQTEAYRRSIIFREPVPIEQCPKPRTYDSLFELLKAKEISERKGGKA